MPGYLAKNGKTDKVSAFDALRSSFEVLNDKAPASQVSDSDITFLKGLIDNPVVQNLLKVQEKLETTTAAELLNGTSGDDRIRDTNAVKLYDQIRSLARNMGSRSTELRSLNRILENPHLEALVEAHNNITHRQFGDAHLEQENYEMDVFDNSDEMTALAPSAIRMVGIRKSRDEPLGMTVTVEDGVVTVARVFAGGLIEKQGLLHVGDIILEVNGIEITSPEQLQDQLRRSEESVTFKIAPSSKDHIASQPCFMRALFNYDPAQDKLLPCKEVGIEFRQGDILEVLNRDDPNWWQARRIDTPAARAGLIPSLELEERRRAFVRPEFDYATKTSICGTKITKKKKKEMYHLQGNYEFDKAELSLYEEICRTPPFERKTLVLIGAQGVGRNTLKNRIVNWDPERFEMPLPHTSRPIRVGEVDGKQYYFTTRDQMEREIAEGKFLEYGEHNGNLYGTKFDTIRDVMRSGRMCVIDCNPQSLKMLKNAEFMPYVVFVASPSLDQLRYISEVNKNQTYGSARYYTFDRAVSRSRRARTQQSLAEFYEDEDLQVTIDESARLFRAYEKFFDLTIVNNNYDKTFELLQEAVDALSTEHQWVPINWIYNSD